MIMTYIYNSLATVPQVTHGTGIIEHDKIRYATILDEDLTNRDRYENFDPDVTDIAIRSSGFMEHTDTSEIPIIGMRLSVRVKTSSDEYFFTVEPNDNFLAEITTSKRMMIANISPDSFTRHTKSDTFAYVKFNIPDNSVTEINEIWNSIRKNRTSPHY